MNSKKYEKLQRLIEMGRKKFVWQRGVLFWGLSTGIGSAIFQIVIGTQRNLLAAFVPAILIFPLFGYLWGSWMWHLMKTKFDEGDSHISA